MLGKQSDIRISRCTEIYELGSMLPEVLISLGILASCTAMTFAFMGKAAQAIASLERTHRARFGTVACSPLETHVTCVLGTTTATIAR